MWTQMIRMNVKWKSNNIKAEEILTNDSLSALSTVELTKSAMFKEEAKGWKNHFHGKLCVSTDLEKRATHESCTYILSRSLFPQILFSTLRWVLVTDSHRTEILTTMIAFVHFILLYSSTTGCKNWMNIYQKSWRLCGETKLNCFPFCPIFNQNALQHSSWDGIVGRKKFDNNALIWHDRKIDISSCVFRHHTTSGKKKQ